MKDTLIIHPKDKSTSFLEQIYGNRENVLVVSGNVTKPAILNMVQQYDRIIMMGHGSPDGLLAMNQFKTDSPYIVDKSFIDVLSKKNAIYIWCYANEFVNKYNLKGFYTGMFISEAREAYYCGLFETMDSLETIQTEVDESNYFFSNLLGKHINRELKIIHRKVKRGYGALSKVNSIADYNHNRLYLNS